MEQLGVRVPKAQSFVFKVAITFYKFVSLRSPKSDLAHMLYHNLYTNLDTIELKPQILRLLKPYFVSLRWPKSSKHS